MQKWIADRFDRAVRWRADEQIRAKAPGLIDDRVRRPADEVAWAVNELHRIAPQVAALEARIEEHRQSVSSESSVKGEQVGADILTQVRAEHERVRARLFTVSRYVERLERLETRLTALEERTEERL